MLYIVAGYGYAKLSMDAQHRASDCLHDYILNRRSLRQVLLLIDARRGLETLSHNDLNALALIQDEGIPFEVIVTKCDLLKKFEFEEARRQVIECVKNYSMQSSTTCSTTSSATSSASVRKKPIARVNDNTQQVATQATLGSSAGMVPQRTSAGMVPHRTSPLIKNIMTTYGKMPILHSSKTGLGIMDVWRVVKNGLLAVA